MEFATIVAGVAFRSSMFSLFATISIVLGCGVLPAGQAQLMLARVPGIATSEAGAKGFVERLVKQTFIDVLESQSRTALLPDAVISSILSQLTVTVTYTPLMCLKVRLEVADPNPLNMMESACFIIDNTATAICSHMAPDGTMCTLMLPRLPQSARITPVPSTHLTISGFLSTTNIILASWSRAMWQSVVNRAIRMLASGPHVRLGNRHCRRKLTLNCDMFKANIFIWHLFTVAIPQQ
ncbi:hypothetical protein KIN20_013452 [Parelaphostrongylus tenuis]|uniref:Uncharacterized protein n=1 Tax=Parelaphostrongylus tenuis TaxID=148309 RepID=A0AAD5QR20_PARTN|nr:hypothetical protein KIN20_013452 [Parelaphostrongylus tenuis]